MVRYFLLDPCHRSRPPSPRHPVGPLPSYSLGGAIPFPSFAARHPCNARFRSSTLSLATPVLRSRVPYSPVTLCRGSHYARSTVRVPGHSVPFTTPRNVPSDVQYPSCLTGSTRTDDTLFTTFPPTSPFSLAGSSTKHLLDSPEGHVSSYSPPPLTLRLSLLPTSPHSRG